MSQKRLSSKGTIGNILYQQKIKRSNMANNTNFHKTWNRNETRSSGGLNIFCPAPEDLTSSAPMKQLLPSPNPQSQLKK